MKKKIIYKRGGVTYHTYVMASGRNAIQQALVERKIGRSEVVSIENVS